MRGICSQLVCGIIVILMSGACFGQAPGEGRGDADRNLLDDLRRQGYEAMYNLDYDGARRRFTEMVRRFPEHPAGPLCLAACLWLEEMNRSRQLRASLFSGESSSARSEQPAPRTVEHFRQLTRTAQSLAEARLRRDPRDVEGLYFLGAAEGLKAVFAAGVERRFLASVSDGAQSAAHHRQLLKLDPHRHDAELTIGVYDYVAASLPLHIKLLASVAGVRGSKKRGLETLQRVVREGHWASDTARVLLVDLYNREKRWPEAIAMSRELSARYPRNYLFQLQTADALVAQAASVRQTASASPATTSPSTGYASEAFSIFESLLDKQSTREAATVNAPPDIIHFRYGEALLMAEEPERAAREFQAAALVAGTKEGLACIARLRAAQSMDIAGKRADAIAEYRAVLRYSDAYQAHEQARRGLARPYRSESGVGSDRTERGTAPKAGRD
ncbi:MAG TPA: hypothetical protein VFV34_25260 [Blastocatellia bacterium]|nr:hypothetical protein [Blastocatellia bacterium]